MVWQPHKITHPQCFLAVHKLHLASVGTYGLHPVRRGDSSPEVGYYSLLMMINKVNGVPVTYIFFYLQNRVRIRKGRIFNISLDIQVFLCGSSYFHIRQQKHTLALPITYLPNYDVTTIILYCNKEKHQPLGCSAPGMITLPDRKIPVVFQGLDTRFSILTII